MVVTICSTRLLAGAVGGEPLQGLALEFETPVGAVSSGQMEKSPVGGLRRWVPVALVRPVLRCLQCPWMSLRLATRVRWDIVLSGLAWALGGALLAPFLVLLFHELRRRLWANRWHSRSCPQWFSRGVIPKSRDLSWAAVAAEIVWVPLPEAVSPHSLQRPMRLAPRGHWMTVQATLVQTVQGAGRSHQAAVT